MYFCGTNVIFDHTVPESVQCFNLLSFIIILILIEPSFSRDNFLGDFHETSYYQIIDISLKLIALRYTLIDLRYFCGKKSISGQTVSKTGNYKDSLLDRQIFDYSHSSLHEPNYRSNV